MTTVKKFKISVWFKNETQKEDLNVITFDTTKLGALNGFLYKYSDQLEGFLHMIIKQVKI